MVYAGRERHDFVIPVLEELPKINEFASGLYESIGASPTLLAENSIRGRFASAVHKCLDDCCGIPEPSLFKICAAVTIGFMQCPPVGPAFSNCRFSKLSNHQNAFLIFSYCRRILTGATIFPDGNREVVLRRPINVSGHFLYDLIDILSSSKPTPHCFSFLALLYEVLAYQRNPKAQNPSIF